MAGHTAHIVDWQQRAKEFAVGDSVFPFPLGNDAVSGRVVAAFPAIGMVDVEYPNGTKRHPVEELQRASDASESVAPQTENVPGGAGTVRVPGGPDVKEASVKRVSEAFVKKGLYWAAKDRQYRCSASEATTGKYACPKCKVGSLKKAVYKRNEGASERLMGCPECLFLIKRADIIGHPDYTERVRDPLARMRVGEGVS